MQMQQLASRSYVGHPCTLHALLCLRPQHNSPLTYLRTLGDDPNRALRLIPFRKRRALPLLLLLRYRNEVGATAAGRRGALPAHRRSTAHTASGETHKADRAKRRGGSSLSQLERAARGRRRALPTAEGCHGKCGAFTSLSGPRKVRRIRITSLVEVLEPRRHLVRRLDPCHSLCAWDGELRAWREAGRGSMGCRHSCSEFDVDHRPRLASNNWPCSLIAPRSVAVAPSLAVHMPFGMTLQNHKHARMLCTSEYPPFFVAHDDNRARCRPRRRRGGWWPSRRSP